MRADAFSAYFAENVPVVLEGTPPLTGRTLTNDLCGQYFKIKIKTALILTLAF